MLSLDAPLDSMHAWCPPASCCAPLSTHNPSARPFLPSAQVTPQALLAAAFGANCVEEVEEMPVTSLDGYDQQVGAVGVLRNVPWDARCNHGFWRDGLSAALALVLPRCGP